MATKIFLKDTAPTQAATITGDLVRKMDLTQGSAAVTYKKIAPNGLTLTPPTSASQITKLEGSQPVTWLSEPLTGFTCSGTVTFNMRALESAATCNCTVTAELYRCDVNGLILSTIGAATLARAELTTAEAANNWTLTPTSTALSNGDRLGCRVYLDDAGGTTAVGTISLVISGATGATGDSYVQCNETVTAYTNTVQQKTQAGIANIVASGTTAAGALRAQTGVAFIKDGWYNSSWTYRKKLTINNTGRGALTNFPVLVKLSSSRVTYANLKSDGTDLRFVSPDGTVLDYEIGQWNASGNSFVWVKIPALASNTANGATVYMYYGNAAAADGQNKTGVWSNSYVAVYHFAETTGTYGDSTSNALTSNTPTLSSRTGDIGLGNCPVFAGATHFIDWADNNLYDNTSYTIECLYNYTSAGTIANTGTGGLPSNTYPIVTKGMAEAETQAADVQFFLGHANTNNIAADFENVATGSDPSINSPRTGSTAISTSTTYHIAQVVSGSSFHKLYVNGANDINNSGTEGIIRNPSTGGTQKVAVGRAYTTAAAATGAINGSVDELRISSVARTDDWMSANYASIQDSLVSYATGETIQTTRTQTGKAAVKVSTTKTQAGLGRVTVSTTRTQTGVANITSGSSTTRDQTGIGNVRASVSRTQTGKAAVKVSTTKTQAGLSSVAISTTRTQTGVANVRASVSRTQTGKAAVKVSTTKTQAGVSNIKVPGVWFNYSWLKRKKLTIDNSAQAQTLTNFPVLVKLDSSRFTFADAQAVGQDLRFTDENGNLLDYEIAQYDNSAQTAILWVKVPLISASSNTDAIYMYYKNASAIGAQNKNGVWSNGYTAVYHFSETAGGYLDSTSNALDTNTPTLASRTQDIGLGNCPQWTGSTHFIDIPDSDAFNITDWTVEALVQSAGVGATCTSGTGAGGITAIYPIVTKGMAEAESTAADIHFFMGQVATTNLLGSDFEDPALSPSVNNNPCSSTNAISVNATGINHVAAVVDAAVYHRNFIDGVQEGSITTAMTPNVAGTQKVGIGTAYLTSGTQSGWFNGKIDEVRISAVARSNEWIAASSKSTKDSSFISFGAVELASTIKTQTGKSAVTNTTTKTQAGVSNIAAQRAIQVSWAEVSVPGFSSTTKTQTGASRVTAQPLRTQSGLSNVRASISRTQAGLADIKISTTRTQSGLARVTAQPLRTQAGLARVTAQPLRTQSGVADVKKATTRTTTGVSNIALPLDRLFLTSSGNADISSGSSLQTIPFNVSVTGPVAAPGLYITQWETPPLKALTINGIASIKVWASQSADIGACVAFELYSVNTSNVETLIGANTGETTALPIGSPAVSMSLTWQISLASVPQDGKLRIKAYAEDASGGIIDFGQINIYVSNLAGFTGYSYIDIPSNTISLVTTKNQTGKSRIKVSVPKNQSGLARVTAQPLRTQSGLADVKLSTTRTQSGLARVALQTAKTQSGLANVRASISRTQTGLADVKLSTTRTVDGLSRIKVQLLKTQTGVANVKSTILRTQTGKGSVAVGGTKTQNGLANIKQSLTRTQAGIANILIVGVGSRSQSGTASIRNTISRTQSGTSRVTSRPLRVQSGTAAVKNTTTIDQTGVGNISNTATRTQSGTGRVKVTVLKLQTSGARVTTQPLRLQLSTAAIKNAVIRTQLGVSRISASVAKTQVGKGSVKLAVSRAQLGVTRVKYVTTKTQPAVAKITVPGLGVQTQTGKAAVLGSNAQDQVGVSRIGLVAAKVQSGKARVIPNTLTVTKAGTTLIYRTEQLTKTGTSYIKRINTLTKAGTSAIIRLVYTVTKVGRSWIVGGNARKFLSGTAEIVNRPTITKTGSTQIHRGQGVTLNKAGRTLVTRKSRVSLLGSSTVSRLTLRVIKGRVKIGKYSIPIIKIKTLDGRSLVT